MATVSQSPSETMATALPNATGAAAGDGILRTPKVKISPKARAIILTKKACL
jgi:hypothetical protein